MDSEDENEAPTSAQVGLAIAALAARADAASINARVAMERAVCMSGEGAAEGDLAALVDALVLQVQQLGLELRSISV